MKKIKRVPKYIALDIPKNKYKLLEVIKEIVSYGDNTNIYFYNVSDSSYTSDIAKIILRLYKVYKLYVENTSYIIWCSVPYYNRYHRSKWGYKKHYDIYANTSSIDDIIDNIINICRTDKHGKVLYVIHRHMFMYNTESLQKAISVLIQLFYLGNTNNKMYDMRAFYDIIIRIDPKIYKKVQGKSAHLN